MEELTLASALAAVQAALIWRWLEDEGRGPTPTRAAAPAPLERWVGAGCVGRTTVGQAAALEVLAPGWVTAPVSGLALEV